MYVVIGAPNKSIVDVLNVPNEPQIRRTVPEMGS